MSEGIRIISDETDAGVIAVLPGEWVSYFKIQLPDLPSVKLEKILPNMIVDYIAGSTDTVHVSNLGVMKDGFSLIAVCDEKWISKAKEAAIPYGKILKAIWPDYGFLEIPQQGFVAEYIDGRVIGRNEDGTGFAIDQKLLNTIVESGADFENKVNITTPQGAGLATGKYSPRPPLVTYLKEVKRLGLIVAAVLVLWVVYTLSIISENEERRTQYADASINIFKEKYPDVQNIVNAEAQMRNLLIVESKSAGNFLFYADNLFKTIRETQGVELDSLSYEGTSEGSFLQITISSPGFSEVSVFETKLMSLGFILEQGNSSQDDAKIYSDYKIREASR